MGRALIGAAMLAAAGVAHAQTGSEPSTVPLGQHWGGRVNGFWVGGTRAPGGYGAYRRPVNGFALPTYWLRPSFAVSDYALYDLTAPPAGRRWVRYYDDAVLIDSRGTVFDSVEGVDWDRYDLDLARPVYAGGPGATYAPPLRHAAVAGGSRERLGGASIDDGERATAGYAFARDTDRRSDHGYGADCPPPAAYAPAVQGGPFVQSYPLPGGGYTTVVTTSGAGTYGYGGTTVTVQSQPAVTTTTTTTEYLDPIVTYRLLPVRHAEAVRYTKTKGKLRQVK